MLAWVLKLALVAVLASAWIARRATLDPGRIRRRLVAALGLSLLLALGLQIATVSAAGWARNAFLFFSTGVAVALLWLLSRLAIVEPLGRTMRIVRIIMLSLAVVTMALGSFGQAAIFLMVGLTRFPWLEPLSTADRFRVSVASLIVFAAFLFGANAISQPSPNVAALLSAARAVRSVAMVYAFFAIGAAFKQFARDPTLGVRRVSRRLALSHVLIVSVPLVIVLLLWVSSTYLGVNADRALIASRALDREGQRMAETMQSELVVFAEPVRAAGALGAARQVRWPGTRTFVIRDSSVERITGAPLPDGASAAPLVAWCAALDSLPAHGIVQLERRRWLGASVRDSAGRAGLIALVPIAEPLDSTLSPLVGGVVSMRVIGEPAVSQDSLRRLADRRSAARRDRVRFRRTGKNAPLVVTTSTDTMRFGNGEIGLTGQALVHGLTFDGARWRKDDFALTARASFASTLTGLFENVSENPLRAIPLAVILGLGIVLVPLAHTDMKMVRGMGSSITRGISALRDGAAAFGAGKLAHRIPIEGDDDLWDTARQFNQMAEGLERARELEKERDRLEHELELARRIQARLLPAQPPRVAGLDVAGLSESAREVGGDYYDHIGLDGERLLLVVADVSGKGVPAALLMSGFRASLMSQDLSRGDPAQVAARLNDFLGKSVEPGRFVTAFLGILEAETGRLAYVNAGHNPPIVMRASGATEELREGGLILGIMPDAAFTSGETRLLPGDLVALYTDGVTEGANATQEQWGEERLVAALRASDGETAAAIASRIVREVRAFEGESGPADDITVLVARRTT